MFENLLASYNPETKESARKQTGSYYTPRKVVDYMVDESLVVALAGKVSHMLAVQGDKGAILKEQAKLLEGNIRRLLDYSPSSENFGLTNTERRSIVQAISEIKVIDPAVGSGAFLMAMLHKLTLVLNRIDSNNDEWGRLQKELVKKRVDVIFEENNPKQREKQLQQLNDIFEKYRGNFGRKLYLIQNNIYGVDIQPIAVQIAKLRFFISLAIEQDPDKDSPETNFGIQPLPNLETSFVAADTLMPLNKSAQQTLGQTDNVMQLEQRLASNREQYFHANHPENKAKYRENDVKIREQLVTELRKGSMSAGYVDKIAEFDLYDQNARSEWFDAKYMFGVLGGFDVVIGNPPYIRLEKNSGKLALRYIDAGYQTISRTGDIYQLFIERGCQMLISENGLLAYITSNSWAKAEYGKKTRAYLASRYTPLKFIEMGKNVFENAIVSSCLLFVSARKNTTLAAFDAVDIDRLTDNKFPPQSALWKQVRPNGELPWSILSKVGQRIIDKIQDAGTPLKDWEVQITRGVTTGCNDVFVINSATKDTLISTQTKSAEIIKPVLRGKDIQRFQIQWKDLWLVYTRKGIEINDYPAVQEYLSEHYNELSKKTGSNKWYELQGSPGPILDTQFSQEKLFWIELVETGRFAYTSNEMFCVNSAYVLTGHSIKYLCAVLNSQLVTWFMKQNALNSGMGITRWVKFTVEQIPIPNIDKKLQHPFIQLVDKITTAKCVNSQADTRKLENEIDELVYKLYGLTAEEIETLEKSM